MPPVNSGMVRELPAAVKQLLSTEISREILRRHHGLRGLVGRRPAGRAQRRLPAAARHLGPAVRPCPRQR